MLGIQQGRDWGLATLNELRTFFKLKPHATFGMKCLMSTIQAKLIDITEEVNSNPDVAEARMSLSHSNPLSLDIPTNYPSGSTLRSS